MLVTSTPSPQPGAFPPPPRPFRGGEGGSPERKAGIRVEKGSETTCGCEALSVNTHRAGRTTPPLPNWLPGPACSPATRGIPAPGQSCRGLPASAARARPGSLISPGPDPVPKDLGDVGSGEGTSGWAPIAPVPGVPAGRLCSPVQHFADPLAHASPGGGGQAPAAAAFSWQVLDGGHHMVRRGRRRWRLQLGLRRFRGDHRGGGGGGRLSEGCGAHSARAPGPGNTQRTRPSSPGPGGGAACEATKRGGTRGSGRRLPAQCLRLATQSWLHTLARGPPLPPVRALPQPRPKSWHTPPSGCERESERTRSHRLHCKDQGPCRERNPAARLRLLSQCPGLVLALAVAVALLQLVPGSLRKLPSVSHGVRDQEGTWSAGRGRRAGGGGRGGGVRALCCRQRALRRCLGVPNPPPGVQRSPRSRVLWQAVGVFVFLGQHKVDSPSETWEDSSCFCGGQHHQPGASTR